MAGRFYRGEWPPPLGKSVKPMECFICGKAIGAFEGTTFAQGRTYHTLCLDVVTCTARDEGEAGRMILTMRWNRKR